MVLLDNCPLCRGGDLMAFLKTKDYFLTGEDFRITQCNSCGFLFTNPRPENNIIGKYYKTDQYLSHSGKATSLMTWIYQAARSIAIRRKFKLVSGLKPGRVSLLDYGCGTAEFIRYCQKKGYQTAGIEPNEDARFIATQNKDVNLGKSIQDISNFDVQAFDVITLWHVLEHIPDFMEVLNILKSKLSEKGLLILALPNCNSWDAKRYGKHWAALDVPRHLYHFNQKTVDEMFKKSGLRKTGAFPMMFDSYFVSMLSEKYKDKKPAFMKALINGHKSNRDAKKTGEYSSLIFVAEKAT